MGFLLDRWVISGGFVSFENRAACVKVRPVTLDEHVSTADKLPSPDG